MKASDYVLKRLAEEGITHAFTVYGGAITEIMDAFTRQDKIKYICAQHEQAAGFMAEGYAKVKGVPGLCIVTSGPGGGNIVTCIQNAYYDSVPMIFITGQVNSKFMRKPYSPLRQLGFQESPISDIVHPITKFSICIDNVVTLPLHLEEAILAAKSGRPGPVLLDICLDVQGAEISYLPSIQMERAEFAVKPASYLVEQFAKDLLKAKRPGILVGGGALKDQAPILQFADLFNIPVFRTWNAIDVCPDNHPCYGGTVGTYGGPGRNFGVQNTDLLLVLGCRMSGRITGGMPETFAREAKIYWVDVDKGLLDPEYQARKADVNLNCSIESFFNILAQTEVERQEGTNWLNLCKSWVKKYDPVKDEHFSEGLHHYGFMHNLSKSLPKDSVVVYDTGGNSIMMGHCFRSKLGQRIFSSNGNTPMGFSMCGAIGAWFADPTRPVFCIIGDGGMSMNIQELQTIWHYKVSVKIVLLNNRILGNTKAFQRVNKRAEIACGPDGYSAPNFCNVAEAYGIEAMYTDEHSSDVDEQVIADFLHGKRAKMWEVVHEDFCTYEPRISVWDVGIEDAYPFLPRDEFKANLYIEPLKGWEDKK